MDCDPEVEVVHALHEASLRAAALVNVTTIRFPTFRRGTYRVDLESGETIKARCLEDESTARRVFETRRDLPDAFTPAFSCHGRVLLEGWIHGRIVGDTPPDTALLVEAGQLLACLHGRETGNSRPADDESTGVWRLKTERGLRTLSDAGALASQEAERLARDLASCDPQRAVSGLGHFDFCGENMAIDKSGRLRVFDNERVGIGPLGFDLARTWYRWNVPPDAWVVFENAYTSASKGAEALAHPGFWRLVVIVQSVCLRLETDRSHWSVPLDMLRRLAVPREAVR